MTAEDFFNSDFEDEPTYPFLNQEVWDAYSKDQIVWLLKHYANNALHEFAKEMNNKFDTDGCRIITAEDVSTFNGSKL